MAKVEVDEAELATMQRGLALLNKLNADPKAKPLLERSVKAVYPDVRTAEDEAEALAAPHLAKVQETAKALQDKLDALEKRDVERSQSAANADLLQRFTELQTKHGVTDEGLQKIASIMTDRSIADPEAAFYVYERQNPKPKEAAPSNWEAASTRWNIQDNAVVDTKSLFSDPEKWGDQEAAKVLTELRTNQIAA